jgi:hypothetical protein
MMPLGVDFPGPEEGDDPFIPRALAIGLRLAAALGLLGWTLFR